MDQRKYTLNERAQSPSLFPITGMGGSAGSISAFKKFFTQMPVKSGMAFVIIIHFDKSKKTAITAVLKSSAAMKVAEAKDGTEVKPDHIYIIPQGQDMGIHNGHLLWDDQLNILRFTPKVTNLLSYTRTMIDELPQAAILLDKDKKVLVAGTKFLQEFNLREEEVLENSILEIAHNKWKTDKLDVLFLHPELNEIFIQHDFRGSGIKNFMLKIQAVTEVQPGGGLVLQLTFSNQNN